MFSEWNWNSETCVSISENVPISNLEDKFGYNDVMFMDDSASCNK